MAGKSIFSAGILILIGAAAQPFSGGAPEKRTGAPGDFGTCTTCHNEFPLNSSNGSVSIDLPSNYEPNQVIDLTVTVTDPDALIYGFEITAKDDTANLVGAWQIVDNNTQFASGSSNYVTHSSSLPGNQSATWALRWVAPLVNVGNVHFYAAGNGANGNGGSSGDRIYTNARTIRPANPTGTDLEQVPSAFRVTDVFPSPFIDHATITFDVASPTDVSMMVYDLNGRLVYSKALGTLPTGSHETVLRAGNLPAGVLFYRLKSKAGQSTGKIVLLR